MAYGYKRKRRYKSYGRRPRYRRKAPARRRTRRTRRYGRYGLATTRAALLRRAAAKRNGGARANKRSAPEPEEGVISRVRRKLADVIHRAAEREIDDIADLDANPRDMGQDIAFIKDLVYGGTPQLGSNTTPLITN